MPAYLLYSFTIIPASLSALLSGTEKNMDRSPTDTVLNANEARRMLGCYLPYEDDKINRTYSACVDSLKGNSIQIKVNKAMIGEIHFR